MIELESPHIKSIDHFGDYEILKCYLLNKQVRMMVFFTIAKEKYVPFAVIKKESKKGRNITKDNYIDLFSGDIWRVLQDVKAGNRVLTIFMKFYTLRITA